MAGAALGTLNAIFDDIIEGGNTKLKYIYISNKKIMVWYYGNEKPDSVVMKLRLGQRQYTVNFNVESVESSGTEYKYRWQSVTLEPGVWEYGPLVSAIISERYPEDAMQAVVNNYLLEPRTDEAVAEFNAMQSWRAFAKDVAHQAIGGEE